MKKILLLIAFINTSLFVMAQNTAKDVFSKDEIVWFGLDFSKAKMIGQFDQGFGMAPASGSEIKATYFHAWNMVILNESTKYDINRTFRKTNVFKDISVVKKNNSKTDPDNITSFNDYKFDNADVTISEIIKSYDKGEKSEGIGLVFIVESFNKTKDMASVYVTFFDIATKNVLFKERMYGKGGGIGLRNYWAKTIYNILKEIDNGVYKSWKSKYGK